MFEISCPHCGKRAHHEFTYVGDATAARPDTSQLDQDQRNLPLIIAFIFQRFNPKGWHKEIWHHSSGCRKHICIERHTVSHAIRSCILASDLKGKAASRLDPHTGEQK